MKLSARNQLKGVIEKIEKGAVTSYVAIRIGDNLITASISNAAVDDLALVPGQEAYAVIKASSVMIGVEH
jgi:molybdopterin-binding protein